MATEDRSDFGTRAVLLDVAFWTVFGVLQASNWWVLSPIRAFFPTRLLPATLFNAYLWALLTPAIFRLAAWVNPEHGIRVRRVALVVAIGLGTAAAAAMLWASVHGLFRPRVPGLGPPTWIGRERVRILANWYVPEVFTFFAVLVTGLVGDMSRRARARAREAAQLQAEASRLQAEQAELRARAAQLQAQSAELHAQLAEARLAMLRTRLNPHFLFNTLNAVSALVAKDPKGVRDMIALLGELLRHALTDTREQEIPLREELRLLRLYLEILEIRYQGLLRTVVTVDADVQDALVPNLLLQPLVENAMKHGIDRAGGHGTIEVLAHRNGDDLVLSVRDTGAGDDATPPLAGEGGVGLRLTRERLAELYGDEQRLELKPAAGGGTTARVTLPYHTSEDVRVAEELVRGHA
jgi:signal transduction histidine kinase